MPTRGVFLIACGVLLALLGVWGGTPGSAAEDGALCEIPIPSAMSAQYEAKTGLDACSLLTREDAEAVLGAGQGELSAQSQGGMGEGSSTILAACRYSSRTAPSRSLTISIQRYDSAADLQRAVGGDDPMFQKISGFEGRAFWRPNAGMLELAAGRDHVVLSIRENGAPSLDQAKSLMRKVLVRL